MKNIAIISNNSKDLGLNNTKRIVKYLTGKVCIYMDSIYRVMGMDVNYVQHHELYERAEIMLVLGGDGTILQAATACAKKCIPVLGINLGTIGFMTEIEMDNVEEALDKLLNGEYEIEHRMMMKIEIKRKGRHLLSCHALNDVVVTKPTGAKLIRVELYTDGNLVDQYTADGLIIATPTGSTGYSISAGGPVVDPMMQLYVASPICAHTLSARSAVLPADKEIRIKLNDMYCEHEAVVTCDGDVQGYIKADDEVVITKSKYEFKLVKIGNQSFYKTLISKLA